MFEWVISHPEFLLPLLFGGTLVLYVLILTVPALRNRFLHRLPCVVTHVVQIEVDLEDQASIERSMRSLHGLTSHARWSPAPPSYHVRTTAALSPDRELQWRETVLTATTYHLRRNRAEAENRLAAYLDSVSRELGQSARMHPRVADDPTANLQDVAGQGPKTSRAPHESAS